MKVLTRREVSQCSSGELAYLNRVSSGVWIAKGCETFYLARKAQLRRLRIVMQLKPVNSPIRSKPWNYRRGAFVSNLIANPPIAHIRCIRRFTRERL